MNPLGSTGPLTPAGKFASSCNALTHGLSASSIDRFPEEIRAAYQTFLSGQYEEWQPATANEQLFLERYAFSQFQLLRAQSLLAHALTAWESAPLDANAEKHYARVSRHVRALERSAREALRELRTFIADRMTNLEADEHLSAQMGLDLRMPVTFPHHLLTAPASRLQTSAQSALRFAYQQFDPSAPPENPLPLS